MRNGVLQLMLESKQEEKRMIEFEHLNDIVPYFRAQYGRVRLEVQGQGGDLRTLQDHEWDGQIMSWREAKPKIDPEVPFSLVVSTIGKEGELKDSLWVNLKIS